MRRSSKRGVWNENYTEDDSEDDHVSYYFNINRGYRRGRTRRPANVQEEDSSSDEDSDVQVIATSRYARPLRSRIATPPLPSTETDETNPFSSIISEARSLNDSDNPLLQMIQAGIMRDANHNITSSLQNMEEGAPGLRVLPSQLFRHRLGEPIRGMSQLPNTTWNTEWTPRPIDIGRVIQQTSDSRPSTSGNNAAGGGDIIDESSEYYKDSSKTANNAAQDVDKLIGRNPTSSRSISDSNYTSRSKSGSYNGCRYGLCK